MLLPDVSRALLTFAHCDDAEWLFGGTVARLVAQGAEVNSVVCTDGWPRPTGRATPRADVLGFGEVVFLGYADDEAHGVHPAEARSGPPDPPLPAELVLTMTPYRAFDAPLELSHGDHIAAGEATLQAVYPEALMPRIIRICWPRATHRTSHRGLVPRRRPGRCGHRRHRSRPDQDGRDLVPHEPERRGRR